MDTAQGWTLILGLIASQATLLWKVVGGLGDIKAQLARIDQKLDDHINQPH